MAIITIDGVGLPDPKSMTVAVLDISNAERNANGTMMIDRVATKRKIELEWPAMDAATMAIIQKAVSPIFFNVTYLDPVAGTNATKSFYVGDRTSPVYSLINGVMLWDGLKLNLVEQ